MAGGKQEKLVDQVFQLRYTSKALVRQACKCEKEERKEKTKVKKAMEKGNADGARVYAQNAIRKHNEQLNYLRLASRLDAVVARLGSQNKMQAIGKSMAGIVKSLEGALAVGNMQKISHAMDLFETAFVNVQVQSNFVDAAMAGSTSLSAAEDDVTCLVHQVADGYGLEVCAGLPQAATYAVPVTRQTCDVSEEDLSRRLEKLRSRS